MKPLSEVYEEMKRSVQEKIDAVKVRNEELEILITDYDRNAEEIRNAKEQGLVRIQNFVSERIKSLEENANERNVEVKSDVNGSSVFFRSSAIGKFFATKLRKTKLR